MTVAYHDSYYQAAASRWPQLVPPLTQQQRQALQLFNQVADRPDVRLDHQLEPGDVQWLNNHTIVHMRSQFEDWEVGWLVRLSQLTCCSALAACAGCLPARHHTNSTVRAVGAALGVEDKHKHRLATCHNNS